MHALAVYRLEIQPHVGQSPHDCAEVICSQFSKFVIEYYRHRQKEVLPLRFDGGMEQMDHGHALTSSRLVGAEHSLATADWHIKVPEDRFHIWRVSFACATDRHAVELQYRTEVGQSTLLVPPGKFEMKVELPLIIPSEFLNSVLSMRTATIDGWPVPVAVQLLGANDVDAFVDRILLNPQRVLPVVLLAADGRFQATPQSMQELQRYLLGTAQVAALMHPKATEQLARRLSANLACSEGVLRIYYPMLSLQSLPRDHPVLHPKDLRDKKVEAALHMHTMRFLLRRVPDGPIIGAARAAACSELAKNAEQLPALMTRLANADQKVAGMEAQRDRIRAERDEARQLLRSVESRLADQVQANAVQANHLQTAQATFECRERALEQLRTELAEALQRLQEQEHDNELLKHQRDLLREELAAQRTGKKGADAGDLEEELDHAWRENAHAVADLEAARQAIVGLTEALAVCKQNLEIMASGSPEHRPPAATSLVAKTAPSPTSIGDALILAGKQNGDILVIGEDAWRSAKASHYTGATRVMEALNAIAEIGRSYFAAIRQGQSLGPIDQAFRQKIPFKYAPCESQMTMAMYGHERLFHDGNGRREIQRHLTLGGGGNCLQVYFDFDDPQQKVVIAYCGEHLSYYRQS